MPRVPKKLIRCCYLTAKGLAVSSFLAIVLLNCANLLSRWILSAPFEWVLEVSLILFVYTVMLIVPILYHDKDFIRMNLLTEVLGRRASRYLNLFADSLVLLFMAYLFYEGLSLSLGQFDFLSRGLGIPRFYVTIPVAVGALISLPIGFDIFLVHLRELNVSRESTGK